MDHRSEFYESHLKEVSRSFAYAIQQLNSPLREWTSAAYLGCRVLDSVEDSPWSSADEQAALLERYSVFLTDAEVDLSCPAPGADWIQALPVGERVLIAEVDLLKERILAFPVEVRTILDGLFRTMAGGMSQFLSRQPGCGPILKNMRELNEYCFFVAGIVGEAMTRFVGFRSRSGVAEEQLKNSVHFGLFLQKINILKDQYKDELEGRRFVFDRQEVLASLKNHVLRTWAYISKIKNEDQDYRRFCAISFFLGLATLPLLELQEPRDFEPKIDRAAALELFQEIVQASSDWSSLELMYKDLTAQFEFEKTDEPVSLAEV